jgi:hypothetical protein
MRIASPFVRRRSSRERRAPARVSGALGGALASGCFFHFQLAAERDAALLEWGGAAAGAAGSGASGRRVKAPPAPDWALTDGVSCVA